MRKIFIAASLIFAFCGISSADIVYTTTTGSMGLIDVTSNSSADLEDIYVHTARDPYVAAYSDYNGNRRVMLIDRTTDTTTSGDSFSRFSVDDLSTELDDETQYLNGAYDTQTSANSYNGTSIFFTSGSKIYDFDTSTFALRNSFDATPQSGDATVVKDFVLIERFIYTLVDTDSSGDILMQLDGQMKRKSEAFLQWVISSGDTEANKISMLSSARVAIACNDGVTLLDNGKLRQVISTDTEVKDVCRDSGSGFFFVVQSESNGNYTNIISHYPENTLLDDITLPVTSSDKIQIIRDDTYNVLGVLSGTDLRLYNMSNGDLINSFGESALGGKPVNMAITNSKINKSAKKKNNSGCDVSSMGMILLLACSGMILKRK